MVKEVKVLSIQSSGEPASEHKHITYRATPNTILPHVQVYSWLVSVLWSAQNDDCT